MGTAAGPAIAATILPVTTGKTHAQRDATLYRSPFIWDPDTDRPVPG